MSYLCTIKLTKSKNKDENRNKMTIKIPFTKMHGAGNDYIYVNTMVCPLSKPEEVAVALSRQHFGIGSDGLILIGKSDVADFSMHIYNADGSEAMMCGNGTRCVGKYVYDHHLTEKTTVSLETLSGIKYIDLHVGEDGTVDSATVDMDKPQTENTKQLDTATGGMREGEISIDGMTLKGTFVSMGNPHVVIFVSDVEHFPVDKIGPQIEVLPLFPQRVNVEFAELRGTDDIRMRVWERGSGITMACGTGACATAVAACLTGRTGRRTNIEMDGGTLNIEWRESDGHIYMTGPAATVFEGEVYWKE